MINDSWFMILIPPLWCLIPETWSMGLGFCFRESWFLTLRNLKQTLYNYCAFLYDDRKWTYLMFWSMNVKVIYMPKKITLLCVKDTSKQKAERWLILYWPWKSTNVFLNCCCIKLQGGYNWNKMFIIWVNLYLQKHITYYKYRAAEDAQQLAKTADWCLYRKLCLNKIIC